jgi:transposase
MPDWAKIRAELRRPHVTMMLLWHEDREQHPDGYGYSQFSAQYLCFAKTIDVVMRQEHKAGECLFVDFVLGKAPNLRHLSTLGHQ